MRTRSPRSTPRPASTPANPATRSRSSAYVKRVLADIQARACKPPVKRRAARVQHPVPRTIPEDRARGIAPEALGVPKGAIESLLIQGAHDASVSGDVSLARAVYLRLHYGTERASYHEPLVTCRYDSLRQRLWWLARGVT